MGYFFPLTFIFFLKTITNQKKSFCFPSWTTDGAPLCSLAQEHHEGHEHEDHEEGAHELSHAGGKSPLKSPVAPAFRCYNWSPWGPWNMNPVPPWNPMRSHEIPVQFHGPWFSEGRDLVHDARNAGSGPWTTKDCPCLEDVGTKPYKTHASQ